jgi:hypothetical protein
MNALAQVRAVSELQMRRTLCGLVDSRIFEKAYRSQLPQSILLHVVAGRADAHDGRSICKPPSKFYFTILYRPQGNMTLYDILYAM